MKEPLFIWTMAIAARSAMWRARGTTAETFRFQTLSREIEPGISMARTDASGPVRWRSWARDADLTTASRGESIARVRMGAGETYDFFWTPSQPGDATLRVEAPFPTFVGQSVLHQTLRVEPLTRGDAGTMEVDE